MSTDYPGFEIVGNARRAPSGVVTAGPVQVNNPDIVAKVAAVCSAVRTQLQQLDMLLAELENYTRSVK